MNVFYKIFIVYIASLALANMETINVAYSIFVVIIRIKAAVAANMLILVSHGTFTAPFSICSRTYIFSIVRVKYDAI
jgi:hypothetical protein